MHKKLTQRLPHFCCFAFCAALLALAFHHTPATSSKSYAQNPEASDEIGLPAVARRDSTRVIQAYYTFIATGQFSQALDLLGPSFDMEPVRQIAAEMRELHKKIQSGEVSVSLERVREQGDWALAVLVITAKLDDGEKIFIADQYLLDVGQRWTVVPKQLRESGQFKSFYNTNAITLNTWWKDNHAAIHESITDS